MNIMERKAEVTKAVQDMDERMLAAVESLIIKLGRKKCLPCRRTVEELRAQADNALNDISAGLGKTQEEMRMKYVK